MGSVDCDGFSKHRRAIKICRNVAGLEAEKQLHVVELAHSKDENEKSLALTTAAAMPPRT